MVGDPAMCSFNFSKEVACPYFSLVKLIMKCKVI